MYETKWFTVDVKPLPGMTAWFGDENNLYSAEVFILTRRLYTVEVGRRVDSDWLDSKVVPACLDEYFEFVPVDSEKNFVGVLPSSYTKKDVWTYMG
ncbi:MAG: hypothetical protein OJJ54_13585 [Pseudonocardia sp.]|nr:hypothetical protein [Pseudonocardia sp.]